MAQQTKKLFVEVYVHLSCGSVAKRMGKSELGRCVHPNFMLSVFNVLPVVETNTDYSCMFLSNYKHISKRQQTRRSLKSLKKVELQSNIDIIQISCPNLLQSTIYM